MINQKFNMNSRGLSTPDSLLSNNLNRLFKSDPPFEQLGNKEKVFTFDHDDISSMQPTPVAHYLQANHQTRGQMSECFQSHQQNGNYFYNHNPNYFLGGIPGHTNLVHGQPLYKPPMPFPHLHLSPFQNHFLPPEGFYPPHLRNYPNCPPTFLCNPAFPNPVHLSGSHFYGHPLSAIPETEEQKNPGASASSASIDMLLSMSGSSQTPYSRVPANPTSAGEENPNLLLKGFILFFIFFYIHLFFKFIIRT